MAKRTDQDDAIDAFELARELRPFNPELGWEGKTAYVKTLRSLITTHLNKIKKASHLMTLACETAIEEEVDEEAEREKEAEIDLITEDAEDED